jgi:hypothetical protein
MKWTFDHSRLPVYLQVTVEGKPSAEEVIALWDEMTMSGLWHPGMSVLLDSSKLAPMGTDGSRIIQDLIRYFIERREQIGKSCIAMVRSNAETYSYVRQFEYGIRLRGSSVVVRNFASPEHAAEWLTNHAGMCGVEAAV